MCIGEVVIELARGGDGRFALGCGGDTFNTAVYLARAGNDVAFASAVGDDRYSDTVFAMAAAEGIDCTYLLRVPGRLPGLCLLDAGAQGAKRTHFWRDGSPARELFELPDWGQVAEALLGARLVFLSGITLSLYSNTGIGRVLAVLELARRNGCMVAFDGNFRPHGWNGDLGRARAVCIEALKRTDIALPAFDDEAVLWGDPSPEATVDRLQAFGIGEIAVKNGPGNALIAVATGREAVPVPEIVDPVDPMAAGDGFNAGYLAARLAGESPANAAASAHRLAGAVIRHRGSILPRAGVAVH
ncbi:MAG: sugar kinase [Proteobacteria bacterium]|nr:sugar kinase [Pseudomonadota bacterium]